MVGKIAGFVRFRRLTDAIRGASRQFAYWSSQRPTDFLPDCERDRCLREAGITPAEFRSAGKSARGFRGRMTAMMRHFRLDPDAATPRYHGALRDAERVCMNCATVKRCKNWLEWGRRNDAPRVFCPNAALFDEVASNQRKASGS